MTPINRVAALDTIRAIAAIMLVAVHVVGADQRTGLTLPMSSPWHLASALGVDLRMPLFAAVSGYVYALRPVTDRTQIARFLSSRARRLLLPLVTVGCAFLVLQAVTPGTNTTPTAVDFLVLLVVGSAHFWFLQALFLVVALVGVCDSAGFLGDRRRMTLALVVSGVVAVALRAASPGSEASSATKALTMLLLPFLVGVVAVRLRNELHASRWICLTMSVGTLAVRVLQETQGHVVPDQLEPLLGALGGASTAASAMAFLPRLHVPFLAALGRHTYPVFLLHVFATAPTRIVLDRLGVESDVLGFLTGVAAGIGVPVLVDLALARASLLRLLMFGERPKRPVRIHPEPQPAPHRPSAEQGNGPRAHREPGRAEPVDRRRRPPD